MSKNVKRAKAFAAKFKQPIGIALTQQINGISIDDGVMATFYDAKTRVGMTALWWGKDKFKAYIEIVSDGEYPQDKAAEILAKAVSDAIG